MPPHERFGTERPPHEEILDRLGRIEDALRRIEDKMK